MTYLLDRPASTFDPARGLLRSEHFQIAYATNDIGRAKALFADRLGIRQFRSLGGPLVEGGTVQAELAWVGTVMYELITASGPGSDVYVGRLPQQPGFHVKHHHLGLLIRDRKHWEGAMAEAERNFWPIPRRSTNALVDGCFVDVQELGHYLELLLPTEAGLGFFNGVPRS